MEKHFYKLPLRFEQLLHRNSVLSTCGLEQSIAQNIFLLITSKYRECRFDDRYGCELWDMDFDVIANENAWLENIRRSIILSVEKHERRLTEVQADLNISWETGTAEAKNKKTIKKRLAILVKGKIKETGEDFLFNTLIYLSPLSFD